MHGAAPHVELIVKTAHEELRRLMQQRAEIVKRICTIKQTIAGLCSMFGDDELSDDLRELASPKPGARRPGLTQACRTVLIEFGCPVNAHQVCEQIQQQKMLSSPHPKNLIASVTVVLHRLVQYGEARTFLRDNGRRAWVWVSDAGEPSPGSANNAKHVVS